MIELLLVSLVFLGSPTAAKKDIEKLLGHWNFPLQFRRVFFAVLDQVHRFKSRFKSDEEVRTIPRAVFDEFLFLTLTFNLVFSDLRAPVCPTIGATDASSEGLGGTEATVPQSLADALFQRAQLKGEKVKLGGF